MAPAAPPSHVLDLVARYQKLIEERTRLLAQRRDFITQYKTTGRKADSQDFALVNDGLDVNTHALLALRAALQVFTGTDGAR